MSQPAKYPEHPDLAPRVDGIEPFHVMALLGEARELERQGDIHYTSSLGLASLRETIAGYYQQRFNVDIPADLGYPCNQNFVRFVDGQIQTVAVDERTGYQLTAELIEQH